MATNRSLTSIVCPYLNKFNTSVIKTLTLPSKKNTLHKRKHIRKSREQEQKNRKEYLFLIRPLLYSVVLWFILLSILHIPFIKDHLREVMVGFTHYSAVAIGKLLFLPVHDPGYPIIRYADFSMKVILECTAYNFYLFVFALYVFAKWPFKNRLLAFGISIPVIFLLNTSRFLVMGVVGSQWPHLFDRVHDYFWNILFGLVVFLIYILAYRRSEGLFSANINFETIQNTAKEH